jgi:putative pyruvate formate lyase activating enzyme
VDVYLVDIRYATSNYAVKYSSAPEYPRYNQAAVKEMYQQLGTALFDASGLITKGLVVRHLVLPEGISGTEKIMKFLSEDISPETYISLMSQYTPYYQASSFKELKRRIKLSEYEEAREIMHRYGLYNGWIQESYAEERFAGVNIKPGI